LENVDVRFRVDKIYTNTGPILIAMNPFKWLPLYGDDVMRQYMDRPHGALPPHCFAEAEAARQALLGRNQAIVICGESGAGKTETTKLMLAYLSYASDQAGRRGGGVSGGVSGGASSLSVADRLLESAPLLEALGNAKTQRNHNSSRFGKFTALHYADDGTIRGGRVTNLLLESYRVTSRPDGERNYHVFYQVCLGSPLDVVVGIPLQGLGCWLERERDFGQRRWTVTVRSQMTIFVSVVELRRERSKGPRPRLFGRPER
jgi:myosin heavy subunit